MGLLSSAPSLWLAWSGGECQGGGANPSPTADIDSLQLRVEGQGSAGGQGTS